MTVLPTKVWTKLSGSFSGDIAHAITVGLDGSIYVSGLASGVLDGQTSSGAEDAFLTKYSADGTKVWTKLIGTTARDFANALATGLDGSIYVAGVTNGSLDGLTNSGGEDAFVSKFKPDGTKVWTKLLGGSRSDSAQGITIGLDGSIFISGQTENALDGQTNRGGLDAFLTKYSTDGTKVWTKLLGTSGWDVGNALSTGKDGSIYIAGYTYGSLDGQPHSGGEDAFLTKFNADGSKVWTKLLGSSSADIAYALTTGLDGSIYVSGITGAIAYDTRKGGTALNGQPTEGGEDAFLTKFNADGSKVWTKILGSSSADIAYALTTGLDGSIYVSGYTNGPLDGQSNSGNSDTFLTKFSTDGSKAWTVLSGGSFTDYAKALGTGLDGSIYVSGFTNGSIDGRSLDSPDSFLTKYQDVTSTPTYSVLANSITVNEGSNADFTITTSNASAGSSISYTLSGVSSTDITGGALTGFATVNSSGMATVSVPIASDNLTEGSETLTISVQGETASTVINDTSKSANTNQNIYLNPGQNFGITYSNVSIFGNVNNEIVNFADNIFGVTTDINIESITLPYSVEEYQYQAVSGQLFTYQNSVLISKAAIQTDSDGTSIRFNSGTGTYTSANNLIGPYNLSAVISGSDIKIGTGIVSTTVPAGLQYPSQTSYRLTSDFTSTNEGTVVVANLQSSTSNFTPGSALYYSLSGIGITSSDLGGMPLRGSGVLDQFGRILLSIPLSNDLTNEGRETLTIQFYTDSSRTIQAGNSASVLIYDTSTSGAKPTYILFADAPSFNEGSTASFNLTTTNLMAGSTLTYAIEGVGSEDIVGGAISGTLTLNANGFAVVQIPIANDLKTEGTETLTIRIADAVARTFINDTSVTVKPTYILFADAPSFDEGSIASFNLTTTNLPIGSILTYTLERVSSEDIVDGAISGTFTLNANGFAVIQIPLANDLMTEGTETLTIRIADAIARTFINDTSVTPNTTITSIPYGNGQFYFTTLAADKVTGTNFIDVVKQLSSLSATQLTKNTDGSWLVQNKISPTNSDTLVNVERIEFNDISVALDVSGPAGQVAKILGSVFGPSFVNNTEFAGIGLAYLDDGMSYLDLCGLAAGAAGLSSPDLLVSTLLRNATGSEPSTLSKATYLQSISNGTSYASVVQQIADSSVNAQRIKLSDVAKTGLAYTPFVFPPTYSLSATTASVNEGSTALFNLTTTNVAVGTEVSYSLSGVGPSDLASGTLTGRVSIGVGGKASISVPIAADGATEGLESLTISVQGATASIAINDTSKGSATPTYTLTPATLSVNEGELARVYVNTTNIAAGTMLQYGVSGVSSTDLIGDLARIVTVDSLGQAFINIQTIADQITEGPETMYITLGTSTTSFIINDTSVTLIGVIDNGGGDGGGGGGGGGGD
jgi:uncharacterized protein (UPF0548 family)